MAQMRKNPNLLQQRLNQMDPKVLQQMGGRDAVMKMMQDMSKGGQPNMDAMSAMMGGMAGGMPGMGGGMPGMPTGMPNMGGMDMEAIMRMAKSMGLQPPPR